MISSVQFSSVAQSCPTLCDPMNHLIFVHLQGKGNDKQGEKTTLRMGEIIANQTSDKGLTYKIYKHLIQLNARKENNQSKSGKKT